MRRFTHGANESGQHRFPCHNVNSHRPRAVAVLHVDGLRDTLRLLPSRALALVADLTADASPEATPPDYDAETRLRAKPPAVSPAPPVWLFAGHAHGPAGHSAPHPPLPLALLLLRPGPPPGPGPSNCSRGDGGHFDTKAGGLAGAVAGE